MPVGKTDSATSPTLLGDRDSNDPKKKTTGDNATVAVNDSLMILGGALVAMVLLMFSVRKYLA